MKLHLLFMQVINKRMEKRIVLQRAFRFFAMHKLVLKEVDRRITAKKDFKEKIEHEAEEAFDKKEHDYKARIAFLEHELHENKESSAATLI